MAAAPSADFVVLLVNGLIKQESVKVSNRLVSHTDGALRSPSRVYLHRDKAGDPLVSADVVHSQERRDVVILERGKKSPSGEIGFLVCAKSEKTSL